MQYTNICAYCNAEFPTTRRSKKYCCPECKAKAHKEAFANRERTYTCEICGETFQTSRDPRSCKTCGKKECRYKLSALHNKQMRKLPYQDDSLCLSCGRAYARPMVCNGCEKIWLGHEVYDEYRIIPLTTDRPPVFQVIECKHWMPEEMRK